jgi:hypothetical protein
VILVSDIIGEVEQVLGRCDQDYLFSILTRAVETLSNKACQISITWDPMIIYLDLPVQQDYYVYLPYQVQKPIKININGNPSFSRANLYEFALNGAGSSDIEAGWQWQDRLTSPIQRRFPRGGYQLAAVSDSEADTELTMNIKIRGRNRGDYVITLPIAPSGSPPTPSTQTAYDVLEVVKPVTVGTVTLYAGNYILANYYPNITLPEFSCIKLSQRAVSVRMIARRKTLQITSLLDVIPLNSSQAVICQCQAIKYQDEVHWDLASAAEAQAVTYLNEEQAARNSFGLASAASEVTTALNLTIGQRDVVIVADVYDEACRIFGFIGRPKIFDRITSTMEVLYNKCQYWDGLVGVVTMRADDDYYVALPRYVDTILAMNINRTIGAYHSPWFEFSYAGFGEFGDLHQNPENWVPWPQLAQTQGSSIWPVQPYGVANCSYTRVNGSNRLAKGWEEVGSTPLAFRLKGPAQLYAVPELAQDNGARITIYGYDEFDNPVLNRRGQWGVEIGCQTTTNPTPSTQIFKRIERVSKDPTYGFISLFAVNPYYTGTTQPIWPPPTPAPGAPEQVSFIGMYWPWDIEPMYRLIRVGTMCKRVRVRYKKNWNKIQELTDPLHVRSREAIILAMTAVATMRTGGAGANMSPFMPTAPVQIAMDQLNLAVDMLDDEWRSRNPQATISLQWPTTTYGNAFPQIQ